MTSTDPRLILLNEWLCGRPENTIKSYRQHMLALLDNVLTPYSGMTLGILQARTHFCTSRAITTPSCDSNSLVPRLVVQSWIDNEH